MSEAPKEVWCKPYLGYDYVEDWLDGSWSIRTNYGGIRYVRADRIEELEERLKAAQDDANEAEAYTEELEAELHLLKTSGIIEVAVRNPNVREYMRHWEGRAEAAEAKLAKLALDAAMKTAEYYSWNEDGNSYRVSQFIHEMTSSVAANGEAKGGKDE